MVSLNCNDGIENKNKQNETVGKSSRNSLISKRRARRCNNVNSVSQVKTNRVATPKQKRKPAAKFNGLFSFSGTRLIIGGLALMEKNIVIGPRDAKNKGHAAVTAAVEKTLDSGTPAAAGKIEESKTSAAALVEKLLNSESLPEEIEKEESKTSVTAVLELILDNIKQLADTNIGNAGMSVKDTLDKQIVAAASGQTPEKEGRKRNGKKAKERKISIDKSVRHIAQKITVDTSDKSQMKRLRKVAIEFFGREFLLKIAPQSFINSYDELPFGKAGSKENYSRITPILWMALKQKFYEPTMPPADKVAAIRQIFEDEIPGISSTFTDMTCKERNDRINSFVKENRWVEHDLVDEAIGIVKYYDQMSPGFARLIEIHAIDLAFCCEKKRTIKMRILQDLFHKSIAPFSKEFRKRMREREKREN